MRLKARLATMPVIEQSKGVIMAQFGWTEEEAFGLLWPSMIRNHAPLAWRCRGIRNWVPPAVGGVRAGGG